MPRTNKVVIGGFFLVATVPAVLAVQPDPTPYIENIPAKLRDFWSKSAQLQRHPPPA
ncbi:hypothetical protein [Methylobacterium thuringiense]|uniref:Uncharacterized protein n=1 Tax=Methylobacterium thuringiense TaxID=1003091 RepID=A0ABQ4TQF2_9HYPH|nr:hypothetical protein [Methylobacterium thuringiense]GJE57598.1 hypothetical protein EKPJFOCH_4115 [Methylobacterium thuringiense]